VIAGSTFTDEELEAWTAAMLAGGSRAYEIAHGIGVQAYRATPQRRVSTQDALIDALVAMKR
jgi:hypothetical protein